LKSFLVKTKIWDSEGFFKTRLSDASEKIKKEENKGEIYLVISSVHCWA
jgi:hypothetical protein